MDKTLVVLAAGMGRRYGGLKQVEPVGASGEFVVDYSVFDALRAGFNQVVFVIRHDIEEAFRQTLGARIEDHVATRYVFQEIESLPPGFAPPPGRTKPWGTGHAVLVSRDAVSTPFAVINADDFYGREAFTALAQLLDTPDAAGTRYGMVAYRLSDTLSGHGSVCRGICGASADGQLEQVTEHTNIERRGGRIVSDQGELTGDELVSLNCWALRPSVFEFIDSAFRSFLESYGSEPKAELYLPQVLDELIRQGRISVDVLASSGSWFGMTNPRDRRHVVDQLRMVVDAGVYPVNLWAGARTA